MIETSCGLGNDCVFKSSGSRRNILAQDVFDKMQQREIGQKYRPDLLLDLHHRMEIPKSVTDFLLVEIEERCTRDVFTYAFESVCIVNKKKGAKSLKWTESGIPRKVPLLSYSTLDWLQLHFSLANTSGVQYVLSLKQIFAAKAELMEIARHEQQNGHLLSSKDLQDNGIRNSFGFIQSTNSQLILALSTIATLVRYSLYSAAQLLYRLVYSLEYLFTNTIGSQMLHGRKMQHASPWSDGFFGIIWEVFLIAACWVFTMAEEDMIIWALMRHKNLGSSLVVCCHLQSIKTSVRTSLKGNSYLVEIAQGGAKWGYFGNLNLWPVWDLGDALTTAIKLMLCFKFQENHFKVHPQFLVLQLHPINPAMHPTCLPPQLLATRLGILHPKSKLHPYQLEHDEIVVFLLFGEHGFAPHSQVSLVEFSDGAQARVVPEPRETKGFTLIRILTN
ncbi:hypothetical protein PS2_039415 [Malus domestica]